MNKLPRVLMLGQYPLDQLTSAPQVRTHAMWQAFQRHSTCTFITGTRFSRRYPLIQLIREGHLENFDCVYLEAATSTSMETDMLLLSLLRKKRVPIGIYIRDAYPLFQLTPTLTLKEKLLVRAWYISQWFYRQVANTLFFPSWQLAECFDFPNKELLLPAGTPVQKFAHALSNQDLRYILFAGRLDEENGWTNLYGAMEKVYARFPHVRLLALTTLTPQERPPWLEIRRGELASIIPDLGAIACGVVPRPHNRYNNMAIPLKMMDYLGLGLPLVTTQCQAMAELVEQDGMGLTADDTAEALGAQLLRMFAEPALRERLQKQAQSALMTKHTWDHRVQQVLRSLRASSRTACGEVPHTHC